MPGLVLATTFWCRAWNSRPTSCPFPSCVSSILEQEVEVLPARAPRLHRVGLHDLVRVLPGHPCFYEREEHALRALDNCLLYEEIQNADQRKNEFLATLSHELRNPLAPIRAALHMLRRGDVDRERAVPLLETMERQVGQMTRLVEDLLDISRITRGVIELKMEPVDVASEIRKSFWQQ